MRCDPAQILLGPGTDALLRTLGSLLPDSCTFVVENPAYHRAYAHFSRMGHRVVPAQMDEKGVMVEPLQTLERAVVYTAPSHQYPLGFAMPMGRRTALLAWCAEESFRYVVEDDYDSEFRYDARPLPSLQSIDRAGRVIYLGTMSGVIAPSLRISYMILPPSLLRRLRERQDPYSCNVPTLEQYTLREFMRQGYFEKHLNRMRVCYRNRRKEMTALLRPYGSRLRMIGAAAGSYALVQVDVGLDEQADLELFLDGERRGGVFRLLAEGGELARETAERDGRDGLHVAFGEIGDAHVDNLLLFGDLRDDSVDPDGRRALELVADGGHVLQDRICAYRLLHSETIAKFLFTEIENRGFNHGFIGGSWSGLGLFAILFFTIYTIIRSMR